MTMLDPPAVKTPTSAAPAVAHPATWAVPETATTSTANVKENVATAVEISDLDLFYGKNHALHSINLHIPEKQVTAFIGPSGCGKSTLLRCINRMNDLVDNCRIQGSIKIHGREIYGPRIDVISLRKRIGMVFQKANPFPKSIFENVVYSLRIDGIRKGALL